MDSKEATKTCGQCHKEVAEANFALHETHCSRFLCVCPDCNETVPRDQLEEHREEQHTEVRCSKCKKKMQRYLLMDHEADECVERLQKCQFCDLEVPWKELDKHSVVCGSRTELCCDCGRYVRLRDQPEHDLTCSATGNSFSPPQAASRPPGATKVPGLCSRCKASVPAEDLYKHELECFTGHKWEDEEDEQSEEASDEDPEGDFSEQEIGNDKVPNFSDRASRGPWTNGEDPDRISTCPHCHLALPVSTLRWHEVKCRRHNPLK